MNAQAADTAPASLSESATRNLRYIRATMDASGAFTSVPGAGTVVVGLVGTAAGLLALFAPRGGSWPQIWLAAAAVAAPLGGLLLARKAARSGTSLSSGVGRRFLFALLPGFVAAGLLTVGLLQANMLSLIPATWLMLYGASVSAAGALSVLPVRLLGMTCMALGAAALLVPAWGQLALLLGFGVAHLGLGAWIWRNYGG